MWSNTKVLVFISLLIIGAGFSFLWFGFKPATPAASPNPLPTPQIESTPISTSSAFLGMEGERALVTKVIDGDTIELQNGQIVRLVGIDTPETKDPRRPVGCFGKEAANETKSLLEGKVVILQRDVSNTDKYGRLLRYVFLPLDDGTALFINDYLVRAGFAYNYTYPPDVKYNEQFLQAEQEARQNQRGLWDRCK